MAQVPDNIVPEVKKDEIPQQEAQADDDFDMDSYIKRFDTLRDLAGSLRIEHALQKAPHDQAKVALLVNHAIEMEKLVTHLINHIVDMNNLFSK